LTWSAVRRLTWTLGASEFPAVGADGSENIYIVMQDNTPGNYEIYFLRVE
jgi:hypothetical protein